MRRHFLFNTASISSYKMYLADEKLWSALLNLFRNVEHINFLFLIYHLQQRK